MLVTYIIKNKNGDYSKTGRVLREPERAKKGVMVAVPISEKEVRIGWSLCAFTKGDKYEPEMAMKIAMGRAESGSTDRPAASMLKPLAKFHIRATRYYKDKEVKCTFPLRAEHDENLYKYGV